MKEVNFSAAKWQQDSDGELWLMLRVCKDSVWDAKRFVSGIVDKVYTATLKQWRNKRSLDANAYLWLLLEKIARAIRSDKESVYIEMLKKYGVFTHIILHEKAAERFMADYRACINLGEILVNGKKGIQIQAYYGSSGYDTKEMGRLIDGVIDECKELGIETLPPDKLALLKEEWGCEKQKVKGNGHSAKRKEARVGA